jgi:hypothetical protein
VAAAINRIRKVFFIAILNSSLLLHGSVSGAHRLPDREMAPGRTARLKKKTRHETFALGFLLTKRISFPGSGGNALCKVSPASVVRREK